MNFSIVDVSQHKKPVCLACFGVGLVVAIGLVVFLASPETVDISFASSGWSCGPHVGFQRYHSERCFSGLERVNVTCQEDGILLARGPGEARTCFSVPGWVGDYGFSVDYSVLRGTVARVYVLGNPIQTSAVCHNATCRIAFEKQSAAEICIEAGLSSAALVMFCDPRLK